MSDQEQFNALKSKGWKNLSKDERAVYKTLKNVFEPKAMPNEPVEAPAVEIVDAVQLEPAQPLQPELDLQHKLIAIFSEIRDSDDKAKIGALMNSVSTSTVDSLFNACFHAVMDGDSRAVVRKYFGKQ